MVTDPLNSTDNYEKIEIDLLMTCLFVFRQAVFVPGSVKADGSQRFVKAQGPESIAAR